MSCSPLLPVGAIFGLGPTELVVILVILLILFGGTKLPSLARGLGQSIKEFKKSSKEEDEKPAIEEANKPAAAKSTTTRTPGSN